MTTSTPSTLRVRSVPLDRIEAGDNDRQNFDPAALEQLASSIKANGLAQPITVRPIKGSRPQRFRIVAGERRFRAHQLLEVKDVQAIVRSDLSDRQEASVMLAENLARVDLNPMEEARAYRQRVDEHGMSAEEIAAEAGVKPARVRWRLDLLKLNPELQQLVSKGLLSVGIAWEFHPLNVDYQQAAWRVYSTTPKMTGQEFIALRDRMLMDQNQMAMFDIEGFTLQMEEWVVRERQKRVGPKALAALLREAEVALGDSNEHLVTRIREACEHVEAK